MLQTATATDDSAKENPEMFGLVIDGKSLTFAFDTKLEKEFLELAIRCNSVICCRSSPKQKALVRFASLLLILFSLVSSQ